MTRSYVRHEPFTDLRTTGGPVCGRHLLYAEEEVRATTFIHKPHVFRRTCSTDRICASYTSYTPCMHADCADFSEDESHQNVHMRLIPSVEKGKKEKGKKEKEKKEKEKKEEKDEY